jgi:hypothetical protein
MAPSSPDSTDQLTARLERVEAELASTRRRAALTRRFVLVAIACVATVLSIGKALAANGNCPNGLPVCFASNTPALASDVNWNFAQLKEWLETKVGPVTSSIVTAGTVSATTVSATTVTTSAVQTGTLSVTGTQTVAGLSVGATGLTVGTSSTMPPAPVVFSGYQVSCLEGSANNTYPICCRLNIRTGQTSCHVAKDWTTSSWTTGPVDPFGPGATEGHYSLSCWEGVPGENYPSCCRGDSSGNVLCVTAQNWQLSSWFPQGTAF